MERLKRFTLLTLAGLMMAYMIVNIGLAWIYTIGITSVPCIGDFRPPDDATSEQVAFPSRDGPTLRGWFTPGTEHPATVIIIVEGGTANTGPTAWRAEMLSEYSTLVYEHRTCADPDAMMTAGYREQYDLLGAVDYLRERGGVEHIGVWGFSVGGTAALFAAAEEPAVEAVLAEGALSNLRVDILNGTSGPLDTVFRHFILSTFTIRVGTPPNQIDTTDVIADISPRPVFLLYGESEAAYGRTLYQVAEEPVELWIIEGGRHGGYILAAPDDYPRRVETFFNEAFSDDAR